MESGGGGDGVKGYGGGRDMETEELLEDHQHKIRELERQNAQLRDKLMVARQQIMAVSSGKIQKCSIPASSVYVGIIISVVVW